MISKTSILENLRSLDRRYQTARSPKEALFCSKLAILELCGWIEESMDDVVRRCAAKHLKVPENLTFCEAKIIKTTWGFDYQRNFRAMLMRTVGLVTVERVEKKVDQTKYAKMEAALSSLKKQRDAEAHTHLKGTTRILNAPSVTLGQFQPIYDGLIEFEEEMRRLTF